MLVVGRDASVQAGSKALSHPLDPGQKPWTCEAAERTLFSAILLPSEPLTNN
jgi:hypothetical protein